MNFLNLWLFETLNVLFWLERLFFWAMKCVTDKHYFSRFAVECSHFRFIYFIYLFVLIIVCGLSLNLWWSLCEGLFTLILFVSVYLFIIFFFLDWWFHSKFGIFVWHYGCNKTITFVTLVTLCNSCNSCGYRYWHPLTREGMGRDSDHLRRKLS